MIEGGLAEITTVRVSEDRQTVKAGNTRIFDLVGHGPDMVVECKGSKRDPVRANPQELLQRLIQMMSAEAS